jgi:hypothetical protein
VSDPFCLLIIPPVGTDSGRTYADMVVQVMAYRQVDPLLRINHGRAVSRVLDNVQLVRRPNTA